MIDHDGRAEITVVADPNGSPRVAMEFQVPIRAIAMTHQQAMKMAAALVSCAHKALEMAETDPETPIKQTLLLS